MRFLLWSSKAAASAALSMASSSSSSFPTASTIRGMSSSTTMINVLDLAAACVAGTDSASKSIAAAQRAGRNNVRVKLDGSFVTDADFTAQGAIFKAIRSVSADIDILGEESAEEVSAHLAAAPALDESVLRRTKLELQMRFFGPDSPRYRHVRQMPLATTTTTAASSPTVGDRNNCNEGGDLGEDDDADEASSSSSLYFDVSRLRIIVDPLDGTKSYTKGEYEAVSILIAIMLDHQPYFGVIGKPFGYQRNGGIYTPMLDGTCVTFYGGPLLNSVYVAGGGRIGPPVMESAVEAEAIMGTKNGDADVGGVGGGKEQEEPTPRTSDLPPLLPRTVISSSRSQGVVLDFCLSMAEQGLVHAEPILVSGAGEKSLRLILHSQGESLWFYPKPGTSLWDVAAPDALLRALRGKLTDKYGRDINYDKSREAAENVDGIVACTDVELHAKCIDLFQQGDWLERQ
jgi:3'-phosphoadenosine 5'-phosphosulfate (PAPS) 3'-phosphatase